MMLRVFNFLYRYTLRRKSQEEFNKKYKTTDFADLHGLVFEFFDMTVDAFEDIADTAQGNEKHAGQQPPTEAPWDGYLSTADIDKRRQNSREEAGNPEYPNGRAGGVGVFNASRAGYLLVVNNIFHGYVLNCL